MVRKCTSILVGFILSAFIISMLILNISSYINRSNPEYISSIGPYKIMKVITGSMIPAIDVGDIIIAKEPDIDSLRVGDIITFRIPGNILVTHRIVDIRQDGSFITKGDANLQEDTGIWVGESNIVGKYEFRIPGGASVIDSFKDYCGLILFFMLLSFIVPKMNIKQIISAFYSKTSM
ncbi:signal peptidase I [Lutispora thermophila]|uniref:Signal peptidase I n=1 Tax=Lutispora thermophila DSM 19022 TaxID=1122184 RepID=A0A1M6ASL2_9FIRM|nr:signal peptidase I [Lutispora thermophila]SHI39494.1 signal peptidase I [Lutispora thermophila DSM 19022]